MMNRAFIGDLTAESYLELIRQGLAFIDFGAQVKGDTRVFIKPNLTFPTYRPGVMTCPQAVEAAIQAIRDYTPYIYLGESDSGGYNRFSMDEVFAATGLLDFAGKYGVKVVNLSHLPRQPVHFGYRGRDFALDLPRLLTDEIDLTVTMPVPKVHANTGVSLTFKNQWGCIPENTDRLRSHPYLEHVLVEVNRAVKARVAIIDGTYGLTGNGPMKGIPVALNWLLVTEGIGAGARLGCELMGIPLEKVRHLRYAQSLGLIPNREEIEVNRDIRPFQKEKFYLRRTLTDWPGFLAFHSPFISYLAYFSPLAGFLHRLLYLVREPFYDYDRLARRHKA